MTPHIEAKENEIAKTVLMPGDPLRAKYIADTFLTDIKLVNTVRNIFAYTGNYKGKEVTVMASGMGMPSIGIYSYELYKFYNVENIIRIGTAGAYTDKINLYDIILVNESYSESNFAKVQGYEKDIISADKDLNDTIKLTARKLGMKVKEGRIRTTDVFYEDIDIDYIYNEKKCLCTEMESFALFYNALKLNKKATSILTISDNLVTKESATAKERQTAFDDMMTLALETTLYL